MGTYITGHVEKRNAKGRWEDITDVAERLLRLETGDFFCQDYTAFTFLAGIRSETTNGERGYGVVPMKPRKGLPRKSTLPWYDDNLNGFAPCCRTLGEVLNHRWHHPNKHVEHSCLLSNMFRLKEHFRVRDIRFCFYFD